MGGGGVKSAAASFFCAFLSLPLDIYSVTVYNVTIQSDDIKED